MDNNKKEFKPYIPADKVVPEFTVTALLIGILLAIVFGAANAYLGLLENRILTENHTNDSHRNYGCRDGSGNCHTNEKSEVCVSSSKYDCQKDTDQENNMVQTIGSAGESVAAGAIFTLPALFLWAEEGKIAFPSILSIALIALFGGILGVCFMVPLRQALIVEEQKDHPQVIHLQ